MLAELAFTAVPSLARTRRFTCACHVRPETEQVSRRTFVGGLVLLGTGLPAPGLANKGGKDRCDALADRECGPDGKLLTDRVVYPPPEITDYAVTDKVFLDFYAAGKPLGKIVLGLFADAAPTSTDVFKRMCNGTFKQLSYNSSQVFRVTRDKRIDLGRLSRGAAKTEVRSIDYTGYVRKKYVDTADADTLNDDSNSLKHNAAGLLSMKKGGGSFEFVITPGPEPDPALDDENVVIGQVIAGMDVVANLNYLPVNKPTGYKNTFVSAGKAIGDKRATAAEDDVFKPLQKTVVKTCGVL